MDDFNKDKISRLAVGLLELRPELLDEHGEKVLGEIGETLKSFNLRVTCGEQIASSMALQAALLTVINTGKRCFKGGVTVALKGDTKSLINWPGNLTLNQIAAELGATLIASDNIAPATVNIALGDVSNNDDWRVLCNAWTGGVIPPGLTAPTLEGSRDFPLGGILAGALAVGLSFLKTAGFDPSIGSEISGISLWRPDLYWANAEAQGPVPKEFPSKLWILGLGHLGQAYSWCLGLLPFEKPKDLLVKLQDTDKAVIGNIDSGLLTEDKNNLIGSYKTRIVSDWLEKRGISTRVVERWYDDQYFKQQDDPGILLSGLDDVRVRRMIKTNEFKLVLDAGLGVGLNFDLIRLHMFPNVNKTPSELWENSKEKDSTPAFKKLSEKILRCGVSMGVASSFTGCASGCMVLSEILRSYSGGIRLSHFYLTLRETNLSHVGVLGRYETQTFVGSTNLK